MNSAFQETIIKATGAKEITPTEVIQNLWSGYGEIIRFELEGAPMKTVVVKHVNFADKGEHPRDWNTDIGHQRKIKSYQVEINWYDKFSSKSNARLPECLATERIGDEVLMVLEDLDDSGYPERRGQIEWTEVEKCIAWLAQFHADYMGATPEGLWDIGTYWHLETRPQELSVLKDNDLKEAAPLIDQKLNDCRFKTIVHGDAKLANFCFSSNGDVACVDFQYVGAGCGMKDLAYFIGSCMDENESQDNEEKILSTYFQYLHKALGSENQELETEWRGLYHVAWADFHRFIKGWSPGHWKINGYSDKITQQVIESLS